MDISKRPFVLLPQDRVIMDITGMDKKQYREFCLQCYKANRDIPSGEPTAFLNFVVALIIGIALSYVASLLAPKPKQEEVVAPRNEGGQNFVNGKRSAPTSGFDTVQNVVEVGSTLPLVYANRRGLANADGTTTFYGGVRVNTNLLWSMLYSVGGGQLLRAIFSIGEGTLPEPNPEQFAIGNNIIRNFDLAKNKVSRISLYYVDGSKESNRITSSDHIAGREADDDLGNAENDGGADVFEARTATGWAPDFCYVNTPSNQTTFGLSGFIGNNMPFRPNPRIKPTENYDNEPQRDEPQGKADRAKDVYKYYGRCGVNELNGVAIDEAASGGIISLNAGDRITYSIFGDSDNNGRFQYEIDPGRDGYTYTNDVAESVASRQKGYDDQIVLGDKYLIGTAKGICVQRTNRPFISEVDNTPVGGGKTVTAKFEVTEPGQIHAWHSPSLHPPFEDSTSIGYSFQGDRYPKFGPDVNASRNTHIFRLAEASFTTERKTRYIEIGLRSRVNVQISGICYFRGVAFGKNVRTLTEIDEERSDSNIVFTNGTFTGPETRYSGFRVQYRETSAASYVQIPMIFMVRSLQSTDVYNYLRFELDSEQTWEFQLTPASSYDIRNSSDPLHVLDYKMNNREKVSTGSGVDIIFSGEPNFARSNDNFAIPSLTTIDGGVLSDDSGPNLEFDDFVNGQGYFSDGYARIAEAFTHEEITTTANQPEHSIVYIDVQTTNRSTPLYDNIATVGMNIRSSREITSLQQFSVYCDRGINSTNLFPEVLLDMMTNVRYGTGKILNSQQIDTDSFAAMATWCENRRYFFDGVVDSKVNIRSWGTETAQNYLLDLVVRNGKFALQPVADFYDRPLITAMFSNGNVLDDSFEYTTSDEQDRILPRVSVKWREEKADSSNGLFPVMRQVTVRESGTPEDAPLETLDISAYCTSQIHAIDIAKWTCRQRRLVTHSVKFETTPTEAALDVGAIFQMGVDAISYSQALNGAIDAEGAVTSWPALPDGTYDILLWDGIANQIQETEMTVKNGKTDQLKNAVFSQRTTATTIQTYKTQGLSYNDEGNISVEATAYPLDGAGNSLLTSDWDNLLSWVIEGEI